MSIETLTINDLRAKTSNTAAIYYTIDKGKEGEWYYDAVDTTSLDNIGTILVSTSGMRFKRVYDLGFVTATWFFDSSDPDATLGIQRALDFISPTSPPIDFYTSGGTVFLPKGIYNISKSLLISQNCRLIGVNNRYHYIYEIFQGGGGTVIRANFSPENKNNWVISSATFIEIPPPPPPTTPPTPSTYKLLEYDKILDYAPDKTNPPFINWYNTDKVKYTMGINVENLTIDGGGNAFGGIRLSNSGNSTIRNVGVHNVKCGFLVNTCWGGSIENCFANFDWYGALVIYCNSFLVINSYFRGSYRTDPNAPTYISEIPQAELPDFIYQDSYAAVGLDDKVKLGKTGIYCFGSAAVSINTVVVEYTTNGITSLISTTSFISQYIEGIVYYGLTTGVAHVEMWPPQPPVEKLVTEILVNQITITGNLGSFYFGNGVMAKIDSVSCSNSQLYVYNNAERRNILFTNTFIQHGSRKYFPDILFIDEGKYGQNYGSVYIDPDAGSDDNYGFNQNDPLRTFDAALIRVQNQSTINPVKIIRIKEGTVTVKNPSIKEVENCNLLITGYSDGGEGLPNPAIYFDGEDFHIVGEILLKGNINLVFRNVNLICNASYKYETPLNQFTIFSLKQTSAKITFENLTIDLTRYYSLIKSNDFNNAMVETKFVNTNILGSGIASLSPSNGGTINLLVDNVQIGSNLSPSIYTQFNTGWLDSNTIRNNF